MRHAVGRTDRADAGRAERTEHLRREQRMRHDGVDGASTGGGKLLCTRDQRAARGDDIVDQEDRDARQGPNRRRRRSRPIDRHGASSARPRMPAPAAPPDRWSTAGIPRRGPRPLWPRQGSSPRSASAMAGMAERSSASMSGNMPCSAAVRCR